jgi:hypothetical protein
VEEHVYKEKTIMYKWITITQEGHMLLDESDVIEAISLDLLEKGFSILRKSRQALDDIDIVAKWPETGAKILVSAVGMSHSRAGRGKLEATYTQSQIFYSISRAVLSALRMKGDLKFKLGDRIALAFPDTPQFRNQLSAQKPALDSFGIEVSLVTEERKVKKF